MNILITGSNGQLGTEMRNLSASHPAHRYFFTDVAELDITNREAVHTFVQTNAVDLIVNCAAYTNVDKAEQDEATARLINATAVANLATAGCKVIHVSTDYVFSGDEHLPCRECDTVAPRTAYGRTKYEGEQQLLAANPDAIIFRTAWLYSPYGNNFVKTMLKYGREKDELRVVYDQIGTPTYAADLAQAIFAAIESPFWHPGVYHFTDEGVCSWFDFTVAILRLAGVQCRVTPILSSEYQYQTPRPHYSVLDKAKVKNTFNLTIPYWMDSLEQCLKRL
ncbi:MAG: dTDP-4-dehydrorhamnose reductase [Paludibacteraceae bacterium]|nr:dTDP-4-dehydrorhamnose reductase [Paludibacteraceae bacterium]